MGESVKLAARKRALQQRTEMRSQRVQRDRRLDDAALALLLALAERPGWASRLVGPRPPGSARRIGFEERRIDQFGPVRGVRSQQDAVQVLPSPRP